MPIVSSSFEYLVMYESTHSPLPDLSARMVSGIRAKTFAILEQFRQMLNQKQRAWVCETNSKLSGWISLMMARSTVTFSAGNMWPNSLIWRMLLKNRWNTF